MKKLLALLLSVLLLLSFTACGGPAEESGHSGEGNAITQEAGNAITQDGWYSEDGITITQEKVQQIVNSKFTTPKNIIVIISDGMGSNDIILAEKHAAGRYEFGTVLNQIPCQGWAITDPAEGGVTDSAASGTALSTGVKTTNGYIGKDVEGNNLKTMAERAREAGKKVGIITDDYLHGATPCAFTVHNISRENTTELVNAMVQFQPDVLMCQNYSDVDANLDDQSREMIENTYLMAKHFGQFKKALDTDPQCAKPFFGILKGYKDLPTDNLAQCAQVAFKRLENEKGFFLMIENCGPDKYGHAGDIYGKLNSVVTLDRTVAAALLYMEKNPDTLLIVTSDHETGGARFPNELEPLSAALTTQSHTNTPVRVFAVGQGAEYFSGRTRDNTDIAQFVIDAIEGN